MESGNRTGVKKYLNAPNIITATRIIGAIVLIFLDIETIPFYIVYGVCGVSDAVDGFVARRTGCVTSFGRKLDSAADLVFYAAMAYKMLIPLLNALTTAVKITVLVLLIIRLIIYIVGALRFKTFVSSHSLLNKATGLIVFLIPYTIPYEEFFFVYSIVGCVVAALSEVYEIVHFIRLLKGGDKTDKSS